jgi:hypothetical protein
MQNPGHLSRFQFPFPLLDFLIGNVCARRRQRVEEFHSQRGALAIRERQGLLFNFEEFHGLRIQIPAVTCNRHEQKRAEAKQAIFGSQPPRSRGSFQNRGAMLESSHGQPSLRDELN